RPHRSATDAILALTHDVELGQQQQLVTSALFMDVKGAFDNVSRHRLIHTMPEMGLPKQLISWTKHFMTSRLVGRLPSPLMGKRRIFTRWKLEFRKVHQLRRSSSSFTYSHYSSACNKLASISAPLPTWTTSPWSPRVHR